MINHLNLGFCQLLVISIPDAASDRLVVTRLKVEVCPASVLPIFETVDTAAL